MHCSECGRWRKEGPFERGNLERKTPYMIPGIDNMDSTLKELLEGVAQAGSWALCMGVFTRGWMDLLVAGGMEYHRACSLAGKLSQVISEGRSAIAKERNESARQEQEGRKTGGREREELRKEAKES
jgi:hypothetical protein